jgi:hypothetical protein
LTGNQWVAKVPVLDQTNQGVVDRGIAVWVVLTHDITDDARTLAELLVWTVAAIEHRVNDTTVNRLHAVSNIWKGATNDNAHRVVEVASLHFDLEVDLLYVVVLWVCSFFSHV